MAGLGDGRQPEANRRRGAEELSLNLPLPTACLLATPKRRQGFGGSDNEPGSFRKPSPKMPDMFMTPPDTPTSHTKPGSVRNIPRSPVTTPKSKSKVQGFTPPPAPNAERQQQEVKEDLETALRCGSTSLLSWALMRERTCPCSIDHRLHEAINHRNPLVLEFLLMRGVKETLNVPCGGISGHRPLHRAIRMARVEGDVGYTMAQLLLEHGADPNMAGQTPLHDAASGGCPEVVRLLLTYQADPNAVNERGQTPLHAACHKMFLSPGDMEEEAVEALLRRGADPLRRDCAGLLPSDYARSAVRVLVFESATPGIVERLERAEQWRARCTAFFVRARAENGHILSWVPPGVFEAVVRFL